MSVKAEKNEVLSNKKKGIAFIIISAFFFACTNMFVNMSGDLPAIQKSFFRNIVAVFFASAILFKGRDKFKFKKSNVKWLILRSSFGTIGIICNFYALSKLVISDASMLNKLSPFFVLIFSYFFLKEKMNRFQMMSVIVAFLGSLFIIKPSFSNINLGPALIGMIGGIAAGAAYTVVRYLGGKGENKSFIILFFSTFSALVTLPFVLFDYHPMTSFQFIILIMAGLSATGGQFFITYAYSYAPAKDISVYDYSQVIFAAALGYMFLGQVADVFSVIGYVIICTVAVVSFIKRDKIENKG